MDYNTSATTNNTNTTNNTTMLLSSTSTNTNLPFPSNSSNTPPSSSPNRPTNITLLATVNNTTPNTFTTSTTAGASTVSSTGSSSSSSSTFPTTDPSNNNNSSNVTFTYIDNHGGKNDNNTIDFETAELGRSALAEFMKATRAYDILLDSNKVIVFDTQIPVRSAFYALVEHDSPCAPLWDSEKCCFTGLMTMSDIVDIMRIFYTPGLGSPASVALSELSIAGWRAYASSLEGIRRGISSPDIVHLVQQEQEEQSRNQNKNDMEEDNNTSSLFLSSSSSSLLSTGGQHSTEETKQNGNNNNNTVPYTLSPSNKSSASITLSANERRRNNKRRYHIHRRLIFVDPEDSLFDVSSKLRRHRIHHMPVLDVDQSSVIAILSHRSLLHHILQHFTDTRKLFHQPLRLLKVGSFEDVVVVPETASVISVLNVLAERHISSVPIVNAEGQVIDVYSRDDVAFLANDPTLMVLDAPVGEVRRAQIQMAGSVTPLVTCHCDDTLHHCLELFCATDGRCERLICVDEYSHCMGIISLSDIFRYLSSEHEIQQQLLKKNTVKNTITSTTTMLSTDNDTVMSINANSNGSNTDGPLSPVGLTLMTG